MITAGLALEQSPPIHCSFRFFLTAPLFLFVAPFAILFSGNAVPTGLWDPRLAGLVHFFTIGFLLFVIVGALFQLLPVLAGVVLPHPVFLASVVHTGMLFGSIFFLAGFLFAGTSLAEFSRKAFLLGVPLLAFSLFLFSVVALRELWRIRLSDSVLVGISLSLFSLLGALLLGSLLSLRFLGVALPLSHSLLLRLHLLWALGGFAGTLLMTISFRVLPMFYVTPELSKKIQYVFLLSSFVLLCMGSLCALAKAVIPLALVSFMISILTLFLWTLFFSFSLLSLHLLGKRKRNLPDLSLRFWQTGLLFIGISFIFYIPFEFSFSVPFGKIGAQVFVAFLLAGGLLSILIGMLYKILPFLVWYHLFARGIAGVPNMRAILTDTSARIQLFVHFVLLASLVMGFWWETGLWMGLAALALSMLHLEWSFVGAVKIYRRLRNKG